MAGGYSNTSGSADGVSGVQIGVGREQVRAAAGKIDAIVGAAMANTGVPGVAVALLYADEVVHAKGYGVREVGSPHTIDTDTVFQLASLSKSIGATAVAALVGKGVISWEQPVHPFAPDLVFSDPWVTEHVTFADLYSHRSGLPGGVGDSLEQFGHSREQILSRLRLVPLNPFRATYAYTNFGMTAGGDTAAKAAGTTFEDMLQEQLFGPAGMRSTSARYADFVARSNRATIHARINGEWVPGPKRDPDAQAPGGGVSSTVTDMATWVRLELAGGTIDGTSIVAADALAETHTPHMRRPSPTAELGSFYGLGWNVGIDHLGHLRWSHSGAFTNGAATTAVLIPQESLGIVVLSNGMPIGVPEAIADTVIDHAVRGGATQDWPAYWAQQFAALFVEDPALSKPPAHPTAARAEAFYTGSYSNDFYGTFEIRSASGGLELVLGPARLTYPLTHWDTDTFTYIPGPEMPDVRTAISFIVKAPDRASAINIGDADGVGLGTLRRADD
jgi:CubicO group peptidase (beta-lactamase class C family)